MTFKNNEDRIRAELVHFAWIWYVLLTISLKSSEISGQGIKPSNVPLRVFLDLSIDADNFGRRQLEK